MSFFLNIQDASLATYHNFRRIDGSKSGMTLANIHQIKGREFKVVFVLGSPDYHFKNHVLSKVGLKYR